MVDIVAREVQLLDVAQARLREEVGDTRVRKVVLGQLKVSEILKQLAFGQCFQIPYVKHCILAIECAYIWFQHKLSKLLE